MSSFGSEATAMLDTVGLLEGDELSPVELAGRDRHLELERLALIMQRGAARNLDLFGAEAILAEAPSRLAFERKQYGVEAPRIELAQQRFAGPGEMVLDVRIE